MNPLTQLVVQCPAICRCDARRSLRRLTSLGGMLLLMSVVLLAPAPIVAQVSYLEQPIDYLKAAPDDPITRLQEKIDAGTVTLKHSARRGYLKSILKHLNVPESTQGLVFSKTSFQLKRISPQTPRAVYFGDDVYVGWVQGGEVMEFSTVDPNLGANFYTLSQSKKSRPKFSRHTHACLQCHGSSLTKNVPGHMVRSVYPRPDGHPLLTAGGYVTDHGSPLTERWGGWYVTGEHGKQRHLGNMLIRAGDDPQKMKLDPGANITDLNPWIETSQYLTPQSDIVALMVLEHQVQMHNLITRANFLTRVALRDSAVMNEMLERPADHRSDSITRRIQRAGEPVVKYLLFRKETQLTAAIKGASEFTEVFPQSGPRDKQGRSLRELDLETRLFKYPCSYVIYSAAFDRLPEPVLSRIYRRLWDVLSGKDNSEDFAHLSTADRRAIMEILRETKSNLPEYWNATDKRAAAAVGR